MHIRNVDHVAHQTANLNGDPIAVSRGNSPPRRQDGELNAAAGEEPDRRRNEMLVSRDMLRGTGNGSTPATGQDIVHYAHAKTDCGFGFLSGHKLV